MEAIDVASAAQMLGVSGRQVRRLIDQGDISASPFGGAWAIDRGSVYRYRELHPKRGRPLSTEGAWRAILRADPQSLDEAHQLAVIGRRRAQRMSARVPPSRLDSLRQDRRVVESGVAAANQLGAAVDVRPPLQFYVRASDWDDVEREYRADREHSDPNVIIRMVPDQLLADIGHGGGLPRSMVLVDLVAERENRVASELLRVPNA